MYKEVIQVTKIEIIPVPPHNGLVAFASFLLNNSFFVGNVAIFTSPSSPSGFRLVYPNKMGTSCFHPLTREIGEMIQSKVSSRYLELINKLSAEDED